MLRKKSVPLDLTVKVSTALPQSHRLGFPCLACGSPVNPGQAYCPRCSAAIENADDAYWPGSRVPERFAIRLAA